MIGQTIGHYEISEKLGEGGMGVVYKALDTRLDRVVALKFLPQHSVATPDEQARFIQEAKSAAALNHPNICTIHGIEEADGKQFIVMEYVDGKTLREKSGSLSTNQSIDMAIEIAQGLAAAHEKGIIHRDIKPDNIMIRKDGIAQIMDFGLAKLRGASNITQQGSTVGTARYMSPEQVQGTDLDHRSDIFSLGVVLYELFSAQLPFRGVHETALMYEIVNVEAPPMASVKSDIPPELDEIVLSCLSKEPKDRFQSAAEIARVLRRLKKDTSRISSTVSRVHQTPGRTPSSSGIRMKERVLWIAATIVLFVTAALMFSIHLTETPSHQAPVRFQMMPPTSDATIGSIAMSPDGKRLAYTATVDGGALIWIRQLDQLKSHSVAGTEGATYPFWSPDGQFIAFFAGGKLKKVDISGGSPVVICDAAIGRGGSWAANGEYILFAPNVSSTIHKVPASGGKPEPVTVLDTTRGEFEHIWPVALPDGDHFLFSSRRFDHDVHMIHHASLSSDEVRPITTSWGNAYYSPPGYLIFMSDLILMAQPFEPDNGTLSGEPIQLGENPGFVPLTGQGAYTLSANGVLATGGGRVEARQYAWFDRRGTMLETVTAAGNFFDIDLSPDGLRAAVQYDLGSASDIYVIDLGRKTLTQLTFTPDVEDNPVWSADGSTIYFNRFSLDHPSVVYKKRSSGAGSEEALEQYDGRLSDWSSDGRYLLFYGIATGDISYADTKGDDVMIPFLNSSANETYGHFSPNGRYIAYCSNESGVFEVYVQTFPQPGGKWRISEGGGSQPEWRSDGKELYFIAADRTLMVTQMSTTGEFSYTRPAKLFRTRVDDFDAPNRYVPANDGQRFLVNIPAGNSGGNPVTITVNWLAARAGE